MLCQNCGENEASVRYTQIVNGVKKEMALCEKCSEELGIGHLNFNIPIDVSSFLGEFLEDSQLGFLPSFTNPEELKCKECGMTYSEFVNTGKFGCANCYPIFSERIDSILKNLHGSNIHVGRKGKIGNGKLNKDKQNIEKQEKEATDPLKELKQQLKEAIKQERYEDAAKLRDQIKKMEEKK